MNRGVMGTKKFMIILAIFVLVGIMFPVQPVFAACGVPSGRGYASLSFDVATAGEYRAWSRIMPSSAQNDSYLLEVDGSDCVTVGDSGSIPAGAWSWVDYRNGNGADKINFTLAAGSHSMKIIGREDDVKVDVVLLVGDTSCVPTGVDGTPCTSGATVTPTPSPSPTPGGSPSPSPSPSPGGSPSPSPSTSPGASPSPSSGSTSGGTTTKPGTTATGTAVPKKTGTATKSAPVANKIQDVPKAALATFAHPLAISQTVKSKYGWASLVLSFAMLAGAGFVGWKFGWPLAKRYILRRGNMATTTPISEYTPPANEIMTQTGQVITPGGNDQYPPQQPLG